MESQMAVSLASAVLQLVDFSSKVVQKDKVGKVHKSTGTTLGEATLLDDAIANLGDLSQQFEKARRVYYKSHISPDQESADARLIALANDSGGVAKILQATLDQAKRNHDVDEQTVLAQGLRSILSLYYSQKTICDLADKLGSIRKQVDVALLASLRHPRTATHLRAWAKGRTLIKASFFSSSLGNDMQRSRMGLLQSLLHAALRGDTETLIQVFHHRWQRFLTSGGGRQPFTWLELRQAFITMISTPSKPTSFFFAIDGLDEFEGNLKDILQLIKDIAKYPHVKVCVASRSSPELLRAFTGQHNLRPELLNRQDICNYVTASLARSQVYVKLSKTDLTRETELVKGIAKKAAGIFLWAHIVVQVLLDDLPHTARMVSLVARLETMPSGLEQLFTTLLGRLDTKHLKHASQILRLMTIKPRPLLLELWFADGNNDDAALRNEARPLSDNEIFERLEMMNRRLISRCRGFLETECQWGSARSGLSKASRVTWTHRIAKDFVRSQRIWNIILDNTGHDAFDPEWHWANGQLGLFKTVAGTTNTKASHFLSCLEYALRLEQRLNICPVKFLDEVGRTATIYATVYDDIVPRKFKGTISSFLEFAVLFNLVSYVRGRGLTLSKEELSHASRLLGVLDAKKWEVFVTRFEHPGIWSTEFEERKRDMQQVMDSLLDRGGGESRWQRARKRLSGQKKT
ncbi:hypothetical protein J4E85_009988 [Alternaria conjuncta]|uniref:uncharacterized protein n=1 Tax=Alternaria conjuncta TaxID=181017 RepID=UPI00221EDBEE|nr:uncharacterized protein J4E85_009988 [Alternaria conjuncta]KAI4917469.1 hypothetical protein J4E85_009988 [Alternaria conjuncta]